MKKQKLWIYLDKLPSYFVLSFKLYIGYYLIHRIKTENSSIQEFVGCVNGKCAYDLVLMMLSCLDCALYHITIISLIFKRGRSTWNSHYYYHSWLYKVIFTPKCWESEAFYVELCFLFTQQVFFSKQVSVGIKWRELTFTFIVSFSETCHPCPQGRYTQSCVNKLVVSYKSCMRPRLT